jgi:FMN phosphatase YigB (HAD superfamily)
MFTRTLRALGVEPEQALMVGDRAERDGAAVQCGLATLLVPALTTPSDRRLQRVLALCRR